MSKLAEKIGAEIVTAMKAKDKLRLGALRMMRAAIQNREIEKRESLGDEEVTAVLMTLAKQRKDSIEQFKAGGRDDLVEQESSELAILQEFLPEQMGEEEVRKEVEAVIAQTGATSIKEMGKVMGAVMGRLKGKADGKLINQLVKELLSGE